MAQDFEKARQIAALGSGLFMVNEDGSFRVATEKERVLVAAGSEWAAAGQIIPKHVLADIARQYDEAMTPTTGGFDRNRK